MRLSPLSILAPKLLDFSVSDDEKNLQLGTIVTATGTDYDTTANVANWGFCELMYVANASVAILPGAVVVMDKNFRVVAAATSTVEANTGKSIFVALTHFAVGSTTEQYGWVLRNGVCPVRFSVAATTGRVFMGSAGFFTPTAAVGTQVIGALTLIAGASTFTHPGKTRTGSSRVEFANVAGMYPGQAISGTGIPGSSVISSVDPDGRGVIIGSAVGTPVTATASASVTCTLTNTGYGIVQLRSPAVQTQIT